jgi:hypothetical protein
MKASWKTTLVGGLSAFFALVVLDPQWFSAVPRLISLAKLAVVAGLACLGLVSKDYDATGRSKHTWKHRVTPGGMSVRARDRYIDIN